MGGSESTLGAIEGYQVARVLFNSPAHVAGLIPYFDLIVGMDGMPLDRDHKSQFQQYVTKNVDKEITLSVYNLRIRAQREVVVTPNTSWGGQGVLGCSLNWDTAERCVENTWHIVEVFGGTPAANSELVPNRDFLIGMQTPDEETITMFSDSDDFQDRLSRWKNARTAGQASGTLLLLVFDSVNNHVKELLIDMGNQLGLGIDVANGYLHVIPPTQGTTALPVMKKFYSSNRQSAQQQQQAPVPVPVAPAPPAMPPAPTAVATPQRSEEVPMMPAAPSPPLTNAPVVETQPAAVAPPAEVAVAPVAQPPVPQPAAVAPAPAAVPAPPAAQTFAPAAPAFPAPGMPPAPAFPAPAFPQPAAFPQPTPHQA